jgi:endonuclease/exonuclease/phosphatase family metal-dependent hydrolase
MSFRVMTYNVRYFGHALPFRGATSTRRALMAIANAIATMEHLPHAICLQEVETRSLRSRLSHTPGLEGETQLEALMCVLQAALERETRRERYHAYHFPAHAYQMGQTKLYTTGLAVLARDDVFVDAHNASQPYDITHRRPSKISAGLKQSRICAHIQLRLNSETLDIFNTHLSLPQFMSKDMFRRGGRMGYGENQQREIDRLADFINSQKASERYLVLGDFNSLPASPAYERLLERLPVKDPFPDAVGTTPIECRIKWPTAGFLHLRMRLDHLFIGGGLECVDFEDTHPFGVQGRWDGLSDHVPLVGRFRVRSNGSALRRTL